MGINKKINILLIHQYFLEEDDHGGSRFNEMTKVWIDEGNEVTVLAGMMHYGGSEKRKEYKGKFSTLKKQGQVSVWRSHVSELYNANFIGRMWAYFSFVFSSLYTGLFKAKEKYDIIIVTSPPLFVGITAYVLSKIKRIPFIFEVRDLWPESAIDTGVLQSKALIKMAYKFERFIYKRAAVINVLTPAFRDILIDKKHVPANKVSFIPNAADFSIAEKLFENFNVIKFREEREIDDKFVITYVGAHGVANHLEQILEAAKLLEDTNVLFQLIGGGMEKERLIKLKESMNCNNVVFIDSVPKSEVFKYILASDMGASVLKNVNTFKTIYSNKTFDYMSCKTPILLAIDGVSRKLIEDADAGVFVEPENASQMALKVRECKDNTNKIKQMGLNGYHYAKKHFDRVALAKEYLGIIRKIKNNV